MNRQLVVFHIANEHYGVNIGEVESIIRMQPITVIPHAQRSIVGATNLRGRVLPVVDLRKRFGLPEAEPTGETRIVIVELADQRVGMIVDAVSEVLRVAEERIEPPSPVVTTAALTFITGIVRLAAGRLIALLNLERMFAPEEQADQPSVRVDDGDVGTRGRGE